MTPEARAARERKQKIFVVVGGLFLLAMLSFQLPKLLGGSSPAEAAPTTTETTTLPGQSTPTGAAPVALVPPDATMAQLALRWILMFPEVTAAIPGARDAGQTDDNVRAASLPPLSEDVMTHVREVYDRSIRPLVHDRW